jgi:6,7-dimethyl-8-ribityllumazine synthase
MASSEKNLSSYTAKNTSEVIDKRLAVIVSEWNDDITDALYQGVLDTLVEHGVQKSNIIKKDVAGSFELPLAAQWMAQLDDIDAVICLGCIIKGETKHDEYISNAVAQGITNVGLKYNKPVIFGVLTPNTKQQALDRAGGKHGNKGDEAAITAIKMLGF